MAVRVVIALLLTAFSFSWVGPDVRAALPTWVPLAAWAGLSVVLIRLGRGGGGGRRRRGEARRGQAPAPARRQHQFRFTAPATDLPTSVISIGCHEVGHGLGAKVGGMKLKMMTADDTGGETTYELGSAREGDRNYLRALMAGAEAQVEYLVRREGYSTRRARRVVSEGAAGDYAMARRLASSSEIARARRRAATLVRRNYPRIERAGKKLALRGPLRDV